MATSEEILDELKTSLIGRAEVVTTEKCYAQLEEFLKGALVEHLKKETTDFTLLHYLERRLVVILAWISVCYARASGFAPQPSQKPGNTTGYGFGADRDTPYKKCMDLADKLRAEYERLKADFEEEYTDDSNSAGDIVVGDIVRSDAVIEATVPFSKSLAVEISYFEGSSPASGTVLLRWSKFEEPNFSEAVIFHSTTPGIYEEWNHDGNSGYPFISATAEKVYSTTDYIAKAARILSVPAGTHYYVLVARNRNGIDSISDEVAVEVS